MDGLKVVERPRDGCTSGGSSTRRAVRSIAIGTRALIQKQSVSGGTERGQAKNGLNGV